MVILRTALHGQRYAAKGRIYYRLQQVDANGGFTYSKTIFVEVNSTAMPLLQVYPSPATSSVYAAHSTALAGAKLVVRTVSGLAVRQQAVVPNAV